MTYHELDRQTISAFLADIKDAELLPESDHIEVNTFYYCPVKRHEREKKFAWYRIGYEKELNAWLGKWGTFRGDSNRREYPIYEEQTPEERRRGEERQRQQQIAEAKREEARQAKALSDAKQQQETAQRTAETAQILLDAGSSDILPEYLEKKDLPLIAPAKGIYGKDLLALLKSRRSGIKATNAERAILKTPNFTRRVFGLVPAYKKDGNALTLSNVQILFPEKINIHSRKKGDLDNKLFLSGKGTLTGAFCSLTPFEAIPNGSTLHIFEGYAKAIPAHLLGIPAIIAFSSAYIKNVLNIFAPSLYATEEDRKAKRKAHIYPLQYEVVNCGDADKTGLDVAKREAWRVKTVFPVYPLVKDWDDLYRRAGGGEKGLAEVQRQLSEPRDLKGVYHAIEENQHIGDLKLTYAIGLTWLISDTGNGKTREVCRYAKEISGEMTILIAPTNGICEQTARELQKQGEPFQIVMSKQSFSYDCAGLTITTLKSFVEKFDFNQCLYPVTLFCDEVHGYSEDIYRQFEILKLYDMLPLARRAVLMTATPHFLHSFGLQAAPRIYVEKAGREKTRNRLLWYHARNELAAIKHFAKQGRVVVEMNDKTALRTLEKTLKKQGFRGVYVLTSEEKKTEYYQFIMRKERLPIDCQILLTTKLYEIGLNIRDTDIKNVLMFPSPSLTAIPTPHSLKQFANRTRETRPDVFYCLPACLKPKTSAISSWFDGWKAYKKVQKKAEARRKEWLDTIREDGESKARFDFSERLNDGGVKLLQWQDGGDPCVIESGLDLATCEEYQRAIRFDINYLKSELDRHGLQFDGEIDIDELTAAAMNTPEDIEALRSSAATTRKEETEKFVDDVARMETLDSKELKRDESEHAEKLQFLREMATPQDAAKILRKVGRSQREFNLLRRRLLLLKTLATYTTAGKHLETAGAIMAFLKQGEFTGKSAAIFLTKLFKNDRILQHHLDINWRKLRKNGKVERKRISEKYALNILRNFAEFRADHKRGGNIYIVTEEKPVLELWRDVLKTSPMQSEFFKKWFFGKSHIAEPETPTEQSKTCDTLENNILIRTLKTNVSHLTPELEDILQFLAGNITDYSEQQEQIYGNVF